MSTDIVPVVLDCDTGIDDSLALLYLLGRPEVELAAVLSTAGNVPVDHVVANNLAWLQLCGRDDVEVCRGREAPLEIALRTCEDTHGPQGIGYAERPAVSRTASDRSAADAWIELTRRRPGELVGVVIGPTTNLAYAIRRDPDLPRRLKRLVIMGGCVNYPGNTTPTAEWNVLVDPEAAHEVFTAFGIDGAPQPILCGLQLTERVALTPQHLARLAEAAGCTPIEVAGVDEERGIRSRASNPIVRMLTDALRFYFEFHQDHGAGYLAHVHDPFAAAVAIDPSIVHTRPAVLDVELAGTLTRGQTVADEGNFWGRPPNALIADDTDVDAFFDELINTIGRLARTVPAPDRPAPHDPIPS